MGKPREQASRDRVELSEAVLRGRLEGKTRSQIARDLGTTEGTVATILSRLLDRGVVDRRGTPIGPSRQRLDRWDKVRELANRGVTPECIAAELSLSLSTITRDLANLRDLGLVAGPARRPREVEKFSRRRKRIQQLRQAGHTLEQIAEQLAVSRSTVNRDLAAVRARRPPSGRRRYQGARAEERARLRLGVLRLRQEGKRPAEIADSLVISTDKVFSETSLLIRLGWLSAGPRGDPRELEELQRGNPRRATIVGMLRDGATLEQVGDVLGVTRERVRQLREQIEAVQGPIVTDLLTGSEAAHYLGISEKKFQELVRREVIEGVGPPSFPRYRREDLQSLRRVRDRRSPPPPLLGGPYHRPLLRIGSIVACEYRDCDIKVAGLTDAPIPWLCGHSLRGGGTPSIIVCGDLVKAVRTESLRALCYYWGVSNTTAANWRRALGVGRATVGTQHLYQLGSIRPNGKIIPKTYHTWTPEEEALLGKDTDEVIAHRLGRSVDSVQSHRRYKGIPIHRAASHRLVRTDPTKQPT